LKEIKILRHQKRVSFKLLKKRFETFQTFVDTKPSQKSVFWSPEVTHNEKYVRLTKKTSYVVPTKVRTTKNFVKMSPEGAYNKKLRQNVAGGAYNKKTWPGQAKRDATPFSDQNTGRPSHSQDSSKCPFFWAHQRKISASIGSQPEENQRIDLNQPFRPAFETAHLQPDVFFVKRT
jgi:hypothetical protein